MAWILRGQAACGAFILLILFSAPLTATDCNGDSLDDSEDIANDYSKDCNQNGVPDECDLLPSLTWSRPQKILSARRPRDIVALDVDGDGDADLVTANAESDNISILRSSGGGSLDVLGQEDAGSQPWSLAAADLDGDSDLDIAVANQGSGTISMHLSSGDGRFERAEDILCGDGSRPQAVIAASFDADGLPDVAAALAGSRSVKVWRSQGSGAFGAGKEIKVPLTPTTVVAEDLDGDGLLDLAVSGIGDSTLSGDPATLLLFRNTGDANFVSAGTLSIPYGPEAIFTAGDLDEDGHVDLIAFSGATTVFWGSPAGFVEVQSLDSTPTKRVVTADLDGDLDLDLVVVSNPLFIYWNQGARSFAMSEPFLIPLQATAAAALDLDGDGLQDLAIAHEGSCCPFANGRVSTLRRDPLGNLTAEKRLGVALESVPRFVASADLNGDGLRDVVAAATDGTASILLAGPPAEFHRALRITLGGEVNHLTSGDLDGDGRADVIATRSKDGGLAIVRGHADGVFIAPEFFPLAVTQPRSAAAADLDGDGDLDLAVSAFDPAVLFLRNDGAAGFPEAARWTVSAGGGPNWLSPIDIDRDGRVDLIFDTGILWNQSNFSFRVEFLEFALPPEPSTEVADLDGDGRPDIVFGDTHQTAVLRTLSNGKLARRPRVVPHPSGAHSAGVGDFDGDGIPELVAIENDPDLVVVFSRIDRAAVSTDQDGNGVPRECDVELGDCNSNGVLDSEEVASGQSPDCNSNGIPDDCDLKPALALTAPESFSVGINPYAVIAADIDGDGDTDVVTANRESDDISVLRNDAQGTLAAELRYRVVAVLPNREQEQESHPTALVAADLDGDGDLDVATKNYRFSTSSEETSITILWNQGAGGFVLDPRFLVASPSSTGVAAGDLTGDGLPDLVTAGGQPDEVLLFASSTSGFLPASRIPLPFETSARSIFCLDVDGDGDKDVILTGRRVVVLRNEGNGAFEIASNVDVGDTAERAAMGDLDGDGDPDVVLTLYASNKMIVLLNDGTGSFVPAAPELLVARPLGLAFADFDGNGFSDILLAQPDRSIASVWLNDGSAKFRKPREFSVGMVPLAAAAGDLDGNGSPDAILAIGEQTWGADLVQVLLNYSSWSQDCDANGIPDACDIAAGTLEDANGDGIAEVCLARLSFKSHSEKLRFHRGDPNSDGKADVSDAILVLRYLFDGAAPPACLEAADFNNDASLDISDAIAELGFLFLGGPPPAAPGPPSEPCGSDSDLRGSLGDFDCSDYNHC